MERFLSDTPVIVRFMEIEKEMLESPLRIHVEPVHRFAEGLYCRQFTMPAGSVWMSRVHKHENYAFIMSGSCTVVSEAGRETLYAPFMTKTFRGTKRLLLIHEECTWITVHALPPGMDDATPTEEIEEYFGCNTFEEYDKCLLEAEI